MSLAFEVAFWSSVWLFWFVASRQNHPSALLNLVATTLLVTTFAASSAVDLHILVPRYLRAGRYAVYGLTWAADVTLSALACTLAIHAAYDLLHGPDPRRFGFLTNFGLELALVTGHVGLAGMASASRRASRV